MPARRTHTKINKKQLEYLQQEFERGLDPKQRNAKVEDVMIQMRREKDSNGKPLFTMDEWLTDTQIKSKFSMFAKKQKSSKLSNQKSEKRATEAEIEEDALNEMDAINEARMIDIAKAEVEKEILEDNLEKHPLQVNGICLCDLAKAIKLQKRREPSSLDQLLPADIFKVLEIIGSEVPSQEAHLQEKKVKKETEDAIVEFIEDNCWCLKYL